MDEEKIALPHHEQLSLCTTRLPYRQGRKLTAVKVYTVNNESKHLLLFGVPSLNLRKEARSLFLKYGKVKQFTVAANYPNEAFTETYHVVYERIQSARIAKKILDTKNFYGGILHISYAPELESIDEVRDKLLQRKREVLQRLKSNNVKHSAQEVRFHRPTPDQSFPKKETVNMGNLNTIIIEKPQQDVHNILKRKFQQSSNKNPKILKSCIIEKPFQPSGLKNSTEVCIENTNADCQTGTNNLKENVAEDIEKTLNYKSFGNEVVKHYKKPINKIQFFIKNKNLV